MTFMRLKTLVMMYGNAVITAEICVVCVKNGTKPQTCVIQNAQNTRMFVNGATNYDKCHDGGTCLLWRVEISYINLFICVFMLTCYGMLALSPKYYDRSD